MQSNHKFKISFNIHGLKVYGTLIVYFLKELQLKTNANSSRAGIVSPASQQIPKATDIDNTEDTSFQGLNDSKCRVTMRVSALV